MTVTAEAPAGHKLVLHRPPVTKDELWYVVGAMFGVWLPRDQVCEDHQAPFDAFADAYFGNENNWALWYGSRGTGKSYMLAILALVKAALLEIEVTILGGSMAQSTNVQEHVENLMRKPNAPTWMVSKQIQSELSFSPGNWIRPLPASQKTVRGPHPHMVLLDEIDEMEKKVYDAAMGQAMDKENSRGVKVREMVVASSTWQNPIGTFQEVIEDARDKSLPIFTWCWREVIEPHGWMSAQLIENKRATVPKEMFRVEYELGEPSGDARAIDLERIKEYFIEMEPIYVRKGGSDDIWRYEDPKPGATYAVGADWAKQKDYTVIHVVRTDVLPWRTVYVRRLNRRPWPVMIGYFNDTVNEYNAQSAHDATGLGNVVADYVDERSLKVEMIGKDRTKLLSEYITDFENGRYRMPRSCVPLWNAHKSVTVAEVWGTAKWDSHLPDDIAASAIMHRAAERMAPAAAPEGVSKTEGPPKQYEPLHAPKDDATQGPQGEVKVKDAEDSSGVTWVPPGPVKGDGGGGAFNFD